MINYEKIGQRIAEQRKYIRRLSQERLAEELGMYQADISNLEKAKKGSGITDLSKLDFIADYFEISLENLLFGKGDKDMPKYTGSKMELIASKKKVKKAHQEILSKLTGNDADKIGGITFECGPYSVYVLEERQITWGANTAVVDGQVQNPGFVLPKLHLFVIYNNEVVCVSVTSVTTTIGKGHINQSTNLLYPVFDGMSHRPLVLRALLMNCLTKYYDALWKECFRPDFTTDAWSKPDPRLHPSRFTDLTPEWTWDTPLRTDYERRQALVEIDVLTAMALGMTLDQLKTIYRIQFPVLQQYEADTWYDANGRIVFTTNRSFTGVGYDRKTWETEVKGAPAGKKFYRTITDDTQPGGPVERTIEYVAPFDKCDREKDYETAWAVFSQQK